jgi:hypothetical protein
VKLPEFVQIEPVGQCNLKCRMCPVVYRDEKPPALMAFDAFCRLLDEFERMKELHLQGWASRCCIRGFSTWCARPRRAASKSRPTRT